MHQKVKQLRDRRRMVGYLNPNLLFEVKSNSIFKTNNPHILESLN